MTTMSNEITVAATYLGGQALHKQTTSLIIYMFMRLRKFCYFKIKKKVFLAQRHDIADLTL
jgi:hypothetical protein